MSKKRDLYDELGVKKGAENVPEALDINVENIKKEVFKKLNSENMKKEKNVMKSKIKWASSVVAAVLVISVLSLNIFPSVAYALMDVPVLGSVVNVMTFGRFSAENNGYTADVKIPEVEGLSDSEFEEKLNREFRENAEAIIKAYEEDVKTLQEELGNKEIYKSIVSDYSVITNSADVLSLDVYISVTSASGNEVHTYYNIDKKENKIISLADLFAPGEDFITPISEYIKAEIAKEIENGNDLFFEGEDAFEKIDENRRFYITEKGNLVICFDEYEIAAGAAGTPEFEIPGDVIENKYIHK